MFKRMFVAMSAFTLVALCSTSLSAQHAKPEESFNLQASVVVNAFQSVTEQHLESILNGLKILASTDDVGSAEWPRIQSPLTQFSQLVPSAAVVFFARPDGSYFTVDQGLTAENLKSRDYFPILMAGHDVGGRLVVSKSTGKKSIVIATPSRRNGQVVGALGVSVSVEKLSALINEHLKLPDDVVFYVLDGEGKTALHRDSALLFEFPSDMGSPTLAGAVQKMLAEPSGVVRYTFRGQDKVAVFSKSAATGWVFVLGKAGAAAAQQDAGRGATPSISRTLMPRA